MARDAGRGYWDVTMPLRAGMPVFPGDPPFESDRVHDIDRGDPYNLSRLTLGTHTGTHVDPPLHFVAGGTPADRLDLGVLNGRCRVVRIPDARTSIGSAEIAAIPGPVERVLFRTSNSGRWARELAFFPDYVGLDAGAAGALLDRKIRLVGIDAPSVERDPSRRYPVHHALLGAGVLVLESLLLDAVPEGEYELRCLPMKIQDGDGAPCRAVLYRTAGGPPG
jgi:arylformamidase